MKKNMEGWWIDTVKAKPKHSEKTLFQFVFVLSLPQTPNGLTWDGIRASAVRGWWPAAWTM